MNKHIVCYDVETTGLNPKEDFIIQLAMMKFDKDTFETIGEKCWLIKPAHKYEINPQAEAVHGISKEMLEEHGVYMKDVIPEIDEFIKDCDFLTYNGNSFDIKFLYKDLNMWNYDLNLEGRKFYDAFSMECRFNPRDLSSVYNRYTGQTLDNAHNALADVKATVEVFRRQMEVQEMSYKEIDEFQENTLLSPDGSIRNAAAPGDPLRIVFNIGKYKDSEFMEVYNKDPGYVKWFKDNVATQYTLNKLREYYKANRV